jgi:thiol-disulfide isomerase/thioredoxin
VALPDGRALVAGGGPVGEPVGTTWIYDPAAEAWTGGPPLRSPRSRPSAVVAPDGSVVLSGGWDRTLHRAPFAEVLAPGETRWSYGGSPVEPRHGAVLVVAGPDVLQLGGGVDDGEKVEDGFRTTLRTSPKVERWVPVPPDARFPRVGERPLVVADADRDEGVAAGDPFPDLELHVGDGFERLSEIGGLRVVSLWATWCVPCVADLPRLDAVAERWTGRGVAVLAVSVDRSRAPVDEWFRRASPDYRVAWDSDAMLDLGITEIPRTYLVDAAGKVVAVGTGAGAWLEEALTGAAAGGADAERR